MANHRSGLMLRVSHRRNGEWAVPDKDRDQAASAGARKGRRGKNR